MLVGVYSWLRGSVTMRLTCTLFHTSWVGKSSHRFVINYTGGTSRQSYRNVFFVLVAAAVHWKWMESFNLILVWSQFYSFRLRVGGFDPCITHSFKNHRNHSNLASNFTDIRTSFMFFPKIWACRWRPSFLLDSFDSGNLSEQVE